MLTRDLIWDVLQQRTAMLTPEQVSQVLNIPVKTLYNLRSSKELPFHALAVGQRWLVCIDSIIEFANSAVLVVEKKQSFHTKKTARVLTKLEQEARDCGFY